MEVILRAGGRDLPRCAELKPGHRDSWAWVAGLIEGEGWISPGPATVRQSPVVAVESTDHDVIQRLAALTGVGRVTSLTPRSATWKPNWRWAVNNRLDTRHVLSGIASLLGERRAERARYVLALLGA